MKSRVRIGGEDTPGCHQTVSSQVLAEMDRNHTKPER